MRQVITFLFTFFLFGLVLTLSASAQNSYDSNDFLIPEKNGDYPDLNNKGIRVRVFVHAPKEKAVPDMATACSDPDSASPVAKTGWHLSSPVTYNLNTTSVPLLVGASNFVTLADNSFQVWSASSGGKVVLTRGVDTTVARSRYDGQNIVAFGRTNGSALAVTYTRYYSSTGLVVDVDTIMNKKFVWSWTPYSEGICGNSNSYDAQNILTHEIGHWMGLEDHYASAYIDNTMYGYGSKGEIKKDTLTSGDTVNLPAFTPKIQGHLL